MNKFTKKLLTVIMCMLLVVALGSLVACKNDPTPKKLASIEITQQPTKTAFTEGDTLTYAGLKVKANYDDESSAEVTNFTVAANNLDSANKLTTSSNKATVSYTEGGITKTTSYDITVSPAYTGPAVESIAVTQNPTKTDYYVGETLDLTGLEIEVTYDDETTDSVEYAATSGITADVTTLTDASKNRTVTITYGGQTATISINAYDKLTGLVVTAENTEYEVGDTLDDVVLTVTAFFNGATTSGVSVDSDDYDISVAPALTDDTFEQDGSYVITVTYTLELIEGRPLTVSDTVEITVIDPNAPVWELTKASFELDEDNQKVYFVYSGTYANYEENDLKEALSSLSLNIVATYIEPWPEVKDQAGYTTAFAIGDNNTWTYKTEITGGILDGFYVAGNYYVNNTNVALYADIWTIGDSVELETEAAVYTYAFIDVGGTYWGNIAFKITSRAIAQPGQPFWELTTASLELDENTQKVYFVYSGTYQNYEEDDLKAALSGLLFDIVYPVDSWPHANVEDGFATIFAMDDGEWSYKTEITFGSLNGYYRFGKYYVNGANNDTYAGIWQIGDSVEVDSKKYEFIDGGEYWGCITFMITDTTPVEQAPNEYDLVFSTQASYVTNNQLLGRWVYYHNGEEGNAEANYANGRYENGTLTFNFTNNVNNWWCTQLFYTNIDLTVGSEYAVSLTLRANFSGRISVCDTVYTLVENVEQTITFNVTQSSGAATLNAAMGLWTQGGGEIDVASGQLVISNVTFDDPSNIPPVTRELDRIEVNADDATRTFFVGETFSSNGIVVTAYYNDDTDEVVTDYTVSVAGYDGANPILNAAGTGIVVTVSYQGKTATYTIDVEEVALDHITVNATGAEVKFYIGDTFSSAGIVVTAHYNNGTSDTVTADSVTVANYDGANPILNVAGTAILVTVSYQGETATYEITVVGIDRIEVDTESAKTEFYVGDAFTSEGIVVTVYYLDDTSKTVTDYSVSTPKMSQADDNIVVTVTYLGVEGSYTITVKEPFSVTRTVYLDVNDGKVWYVIAGTYAGYSEDTLRGQLTNVHFDLENNPSADGATGGWEERFVFSAENRQIVISTEEGSWELRFDVTDFRNSAYTSHYTGEKNNLEFEETDYDGKGKTSNGGKEFELANYPHSDKGEEFWGAIGLYVRYTYTLTDVDVALSDGEDKAYYVLSGTYNDSIDAELFKSYLLSVYFDFESTSNWQRTTELERIAEASNGQWKLSIDVTDLYVSGFVPHFEITLNQNWGTEYGDVDIPDNRNNGNNKTIGTKTYTIVNNGTDFFEHVGLQITDERTYTIDMMSVSLDTTMGKPVLIITGTYTGTFTKEEFDFDMQYTGDWQTAKYESITVTLDEGTFTVKVNLLNGKFDDGRTVASVDKGPAWVLHFWVAGQSTDIECFEDSANFEDVLSTLNLDGTTYQIVIKDMGWGGRKMIVLIISEA